MNDLEIRISFHKIKLRHHHNHRNTLVIDELGLNHGKNRADIAVINGQFIGYEIKGDNDSLSRLKEQVRSYNAVFDEAYLVAGNRYTNTIHKYLPPWWGIIEVIKNDGTDINFKIIRKARTNKCVEPISIARLLWRDEVLEILKQKRTPTNILREPRAALYQHLVDTTNISEIKKRVKDFLIRRKNWRCPESLSQYDDSCQPAAT